MAETPQESPTNSPLSPEYSKAVRAAVVTYPNVLEDARKGAWEQIERMRGSTLTHLSVGLLRGKAAVVATIACLTPLGILIPWTANGGLVTGIVIMLVMLALIATLILSLVIDLRRHASLPTVVFWDYWAFLVVLRLRSWGLGKDAIKYVQKQSGYAFKQRMDALTFLAKLSATAAVIIKGRDFIGRSVRNVLGLSEPPTLPSTPPTLSTVEFFLIVLSIALAFLIVSFLSFISLSHQHVDAAVEYYAGLSDAELAHSGRLSESLAKVVKEQKEQLGLEHGKDSLSPDKPVANHPPVLGEPTPPSTL